MEQGTGQPIRGLIFELETLLPGSTALFRRYAKRREEDREAWLAQAEKELKPQIGATERLEAWRGNYSMALLAHMPLKPAGELIKQAGWRNIFGVFIGEEHLTGIPISNYAAAYQLAADRLRLKPEECIAFIRSEAGVQGPLLIGMKNCYVGKYRSWWRTGPKPQFKANNFEDSAISEAIGARKQSS